MINKNGTVEPGIWKHGIWKLGSIGNTIVVKKLLISSNMLTLLATLEFLSLLWKLETAFQSIFVFPDTRLYCTVVIDSEFFMIILKYFLVMSTNFNLL
jgi:hypothetical protein